MVYRVGCFGLISLLIVFVSCRRAAEPSASDADSGHGSSSASASPVDETNGLRPTQPLHPPAAPATPPPLHPKIERLDIPFFSGAGAIWGATGSDNQGNIYFGVADSEAAPLPSAHLLRLDPRTDTTTDLGDVVGQMQRAGVHRDGESQLKIHSKIVVGADGALYFASMDERGEVEDGSRYPTWGGHLWRLRSGAEQWEHLLATKEALIAVAAGGRWIYALGYFQHVLYQFDTQTSDVRSVAVGSAGGHISRNFLADSQGHVYVPRVSDVSREKNPEQLPATTEVGGRFLASTIVEFDSDLKEIQSLPLDYYDPDLGADSHGIVGIAYQDDGSIGFTTHTGFLYRILPMTDVPALVEKLGWVHPSGRSYPSCLYPWAGSRYFVGMTRVRGGSFEWFVFDTVNRTTTIAAWPDGAGNLLTQEGLLLYGSNTRDRDGRCYVVGRYLEGVNHRPLVMRISPDQ
jgi:hypothetical protein